VVVGDETAVAGQLARLADAGVTDLAAHLFGTPAEQANTNGVLAVLA
jgi:hypothetical protein